MTTTTRDSELLTIGVGDLPGRDSSDFRIRIGWGTAHDAELPYYEPRSSSRPHRSLASFRRPKILRRLMGYLIQDEGTESRVAFVMDGTLVHYYLPTKELQKAGIQKENQPFEMDELETEIDGTVFTAYKFRPSVPASMGRVESLPLDETRRRKLAGILTRRTNAKD